MKIVHLSTSDMGGAGVAAKRLHLALLGKGVDSVFLSLNKLGPEIKDHMLISVPEESGVSVFIKKIKRRLGITDRLNNFYSRKPAGFEHFSFPRGLKDLHRHPAIKSADIVHLHWVSDGLLDFRSFFSQIKKPVLWTLHDMNAFTGGCHHADACLGFITGCADCLQIKGTGMEKIAEENLRLKEKALSNMPDSRLAVVCPSSWLAALVKQSRLFKRFELNVIPNISSPVFKYTPKEDARRILGIDASGDVLLFVSNDLNNVRKGILELIQAINTTESRSMQIVTVGRSLPANQISKPVRDFGFITSEEKMALIYSAADVFVLPSYAENLPNTIIESLMCGTPVIASGGGGIPEIINNSNGEVIPPRDPGLLKAAINRAISDKSRFDRNKISIDARERFLSGSIINKYIDCYKRF